MAFTSRWGARMKARWPHVRILRVFGTDGSRAWEIYLLPRQADVVYPAPKPPKAKPAPPPAANTSPPTTASPQVNALPLIGPATQTPAVPEPQIRLAPPTDRPAQPPADPTWTTPAINVQEVSPATDLPRRPTPAESGRERLPRPSPYLQPPRKPPSRYRDPPVFKVFGRDPITPAEPDQARPRTEPAAVEPEVSRPTAEPAASEPVAVEPVAVERAAFQPVDDVPDLFQPMTPPRPARSPTPARASLPHRSPPRPLPPPAPPPPAAQPPAPPPVVLPPVEAPSPAAPVAVEAAKVEAAKDEASKAGPAAYTWVHLRGVPDGPPGDPHRHVSRYMVTIRASVDLDAALRQSGVNAALRRLAQDPEDRTRRDDVVAELTAAPTPTRFTTTIFDLSTLRAAGEEGFLDGLLVIRNQGIQIGEQGLRPHHLTYVTTPTAEATRLLETNPRLAGALVDHLCPVPSAAAEVEELAHLVHEAIAERDRPASGPPNGKARPGLPPRGPGTVLRIEHFDGGRMGSRNVHVGRHIPGSEPSASALPINGSGPKIDTTAPPEVQSSPKTVSSPDSSPEVPPVTALPHANGSAPAADVPSAGTERKPRPTIDAADRILELDPRTIDLHPSLGQYLAALSDHIGYEVGTRAEPHPDPDHGQAADDDLWLEDLTAPSYPDREYPDREYPEHERDRDDDRDLGFGIAGR
jgi:hypothetical protein